jgi:hypothetical protein
MATGPESRVENTGRIRAMTLTLWPVALVLKPGLLALFAAMPLPVLACSPQPGRSSTPGRCR